MIHLDSSLILCGFLLQPLEGSTDIPVTYWSLLQGAVALSFFFLFFSVPEVSHDLCHMKIFSSRERHRGFPHVYNQLTNDEFSKQMLFFFLFSECNILHNN